MKRLIATLAASVASFAGLAANVSACPTVPPCGYVYRYYYAPEYDCELPPHHAGRFAPGVIPNGNGVGPRTSFRPNNGDPGVNVGPNGTTPTPKAIQRPGQPVGFVPGNNGVVPGGRPGGGITPNAGNGGVAIGPGGRTPQPFQFQNPGGGRPGGGITPNAGNGGVAIGPGGRTAQPFILPPNSGGGRPGGGITPNAGNGGVAIGPGGRTPQPFQFQAPGSARPGGGIRPNAGNSGASIGPGGRTPTLERAAPSTGNVPTRRR